MRPLSSSSDGRLQLVTLCGLLGLRTDTSSTFPSGARLPPSMVHASRKKSEISLPTLSKVVPGSLEMGRTSTLGMIPRSLAHPFKLASINSELPHTPSPLSRQSNLPRTLLDGETPQMATSLLRLPSTLFDQGLPLCSGPSLSGMGDAILIREVGSTDEMKIERTRLEVVNARKLDEGMEPAALERVAAEVRQAIQKARVAKKMSQAELAKQINERLQVVEEYENGKAVPN
ncbi:hypothetical protein MRB53_023114 [Persea americana]|uniref:Uncharacterized protein n=1 Tax=Persea americana TaxID=3435 RepID=A0ACC2L8N4_PERAE|nr:hypothetical protein MRB53_023114 [Persea americana]